MFLNDVRKLLRVHAIIIKRARPLWEGSLKEITQMDDKEPREGVELKTSFKKPVLAMELEEPVKFSQREEEMA